MRRARAPAARRAAGHSGAVPGYRPSFQSTQSPSPFAGLRPNTRIAGNARWIGYLAFQERTKNPGMVRKRQGRLVSTRYGSYAPAVHSYS